MPQGEIPKEAVLITRRFFVAVEIISDKGLIRGLGTLAKKWDVSRFVLSTTRSFPEKKRMNTEWIYYISRDYGVSVEWIISGKGSMFSE